MIRQSEGTRPLRYSRANRDSGHPASLAISIFLTVAIVAALAFANLPVAFIDGAAPFWQHPSADAAEHIIGGRYFIADAWRFPLLFVPGLGTPDGTNIGLTDSIPMAAVAAKLLRGILGFQRPYLPWWIFLCYLSQAPAGILALYALGVRRTVLLTLGGLLLVFAPVLWFRFGHAALCAQYLIVLALALHLHVARCGFRRLTLPLFVPLLVFTLLVHVYLFAMVFAVLLASLLQGLWTEQLDMRHVIVLLAASAIAVVLVMWVCGYLSLGPIPMKPYGEAALDLGAPFSPGPSGVFGVQQLPPGRSYEGFAWAGSGIVLLLIITVVAWRGRLVAILENHFPLVVILGALTLFALSYAVRLGPWLILGIATDTMRRAALESQQHGGMLRSLVASLRPTDYVRIGLYALLLIGLYSSVMVYAWRRRRWQFVRFVLGATACLFLASAIDPRAIALIISNFQASGRFVWVPLYLLSLLAVAGVCNACRPALAVTLLCLGLGLQMFDVAPFWGALREDAMAGPGAIPGETAITAAVSRARQAILVPTYLCAYAEPLGAIRRDILVARIVGVQVVASRWAVPINSVRNSRMMATDKTALAGKCAQDRRSALLGVGDRETATIVFGDGPDEAELRRVLAARPDCQTLPSEVLCAGPTPASERNNGAHHDR